MESIFSKTLTWSSLAASVTAAAAIGATFVWLQKEVEQNNERSLERLEYAVKETSIARLEFDRYREETIRTKIELEQVVKQVSLLNALIKERENQIDSLRDRIRALEEQPLR